MLKLRTILLYDFIYIIIFLLTFIYVVININIKQESKYTNEYFQEEVIVLTSHITSNKLTLEIKGQKDEVLTAIYFFENKEQLELYKKNIQLGDFLYLTGNLDEIEESTNINIFNYKTYQNRRGIFYTLKIDSLKKISPNNNIFYKIKNYLIKKCNKNPYLHLFILGDNYYLPKEIETSFQEIAISHLFAISGMHISLWSLILLKILKLFKVKEITSYLIVAIFLLFYLVLLGLTPSVVRSVLFFILFSINNIFYFHIKKTNIFLIVLSTTLLINPNFIFDVAFQYSFCISLALLLIVEKLPNKKYLLTTFLISTISFLVSIPICLYHFYQINFLSILYNIFYVPLISIVIFPFAIITFIIPLLEPILNFLTNFLEVTSKFLSEINIFKLVLRKINIIFYILYYPIIIIAIISIYKKRIYFLILPMYLLIHYYFTINNIFILMIDIGQGDAFLLYDKGETILIDTGGRSNFYNEFDKDIISSSLTESIIIPIIRSLGVKKLNKVILTHGDNDHLGEYNNINDRIEIENTYINNNYQNYYEKQIQNKTILKENTYFKTNNFNIYSINSYKTNDENDSSVILLISINNINLLFMGDAGIKTEQHLLNNYNLPKITFLKVGHHGSNTSTSINLLKQITPTYALISAGKNNSFNHPHQEVIDNLNKYNTKIYSTKDNGSIYLDFSNNDYQILDKNYNIR